MVIGNIKVLIIEPDIQFQSILKRKLGKDKSIVTFIGEVSEDSNINLNKFNVIFLGENSKNRSANEAYNIIRNFGYKGHIVIMTTNRFFQRDKYNGIAAAISKPFDSDELRNLLEKLHIDEVDSKNTIDKVGGIYVSTGS